MPPPSPPLLLAPTRWRLALRVILGLGSGFALSLAFAPADLGVLAWVSLVPLLLGLRGASVGGGLVTGFAFGFAFFGVFAAWITLVGWEAWAGLVPLQAVFLAAFGVLAAPMSRGGPLARIIGIPLLWTGLELARTRLPLGGFGFGTLGSSQHAGLPLLGLARAGGAITVTLVIVAINALLAEAVVVRRTAARAILIVAAVAAIALPGLLPLGAPASGDTVDVAMVQGNVPRNYFRGLARGRVGPEDEVIIANHLRLTATLADDPPDLIIWPENALDRDPFVDPVAKEAVATVLAQIQRPFLVGAILDGEGPKTFYNANLLFAADGALAGRYDKNHLVPFGEYVPWAWARRLIPSLDQVPSDGIPGTRANLLQTGNLPPIGSVICFESSDASHVRRFAQAGAQIIVVTTNNATFERSPLARQHLALSRMRAVENGRPVLHSAIAGISAVIDARGRIIQTAALFTPAILRQSVTGGVGQTPWVRFGEAIEASVVAGAVLAALIALMLAARRRLPGLQLHDDDDDDAFWVSDDFQPIGRQDLTPVAEQEAEPPGPIESSPFGRQDLTRVAKQEALQHEPIESSPSGAPGTTGSAADGGAETT